MNTSKEIWTKNMNRTFINTKANKLYAAHHYKQNYQNFSESRHL